MNLYQGTADELTNRILVLIPDNPQIMDMEKAWELYDIDDFKCDDLQPSTFQAGWALNKAKQLYREEGT